MDRTERDMVIRGARPGRVGRDRRAATKHRAVTCGIVALLATAALAATGCGSPGEASGDDSTAPFATVPTTVFIPPPPPAPAPTVAPPTTVAAPVVEEVLPAPVETEPVVEEEWAEEEWVEEEEWAEEEWVEEEWADDASSEADSDFDGIPDSEDIDMYEDSDYDGIPNNDDWNMGNPILDNFNNNMSAINVWSS